MSDTLVGLDELLGREGGCPLALSFLANDFRCVVRDVRIVGLGSNGVGTLFLRDDEGNVAVQG